MARPLFNTDEDEEDPYNDEEAKRKGVHWGEDVADRQRGDANKNVTFGNASNNTTGIVALNMNRSKIGFGQEDYK